MKYERFGSLAILNSSVGKIKGKGESHVRFRTLGECPLEGTLILSRRHSEVGWLGPFLAAFNFPSVATRNPFAAGWTVSEHPIYDPRVRARTIDVPLSSQAL